jgi:hypothetical protein
VAFIPAGAEEARDACYEAGLEDVVERPIESAPLRVRLRAAGRLADRDEALTLMSADLALLREQIDRNSDQVPALLHALLDLGFPGSIDRGLRTVELALKLAALQRPMRRMRDPSKPRGSRASAWSRPRAEPWAPGNDAWHYTRATVAILQRRGLRAPLSDRQHLRELTAPAA